MSKIMNKRKSNPEYATKYIKENYKRHEIKLQSDDEVKLQTILKKYNMNIKEYLLLKLQEDLNKI